MTIEERREALAPLAESILALQGQDGLVMIYPHLNADGDAYGSSLGLALAIQKLGIEVLCIYEEEVKQEYKHFAGLSLVRIWPSLSAEEKQALLSRQLMGIQIDLSVSHRLATRRDAWLAAPSRKTVDHHISEQVSDEDNFIFSDAAASCELVYHIIDALEHLSGVTLFDRDIATNLYTGLMMDTGNFCYPNVRPMTLAVAAKLLEFGVAIPELVERHFGRISWTRYKIEGAVSAYTQRALDGRITYLGIKPELVTQFGADDADLEGIPGQLRNIEGTDVSLMLRQGSDGSIRGNLRSQPEVDIQGFAMELGGGGHKNAAGFTLPPGDLDQALDDVVAKLIVRLSEES